MGIEVRRAELPQLTGLRGLAAFTVLFGHLKTLEGQVLDFGPFDAFAQFGGFGVDLFFVLSGFILCHVYSKRMLSEPGVWREFAIARFARIYPLHIVCLVLMLGAHFVASRLGVSPTEDSGYTLKSSLFSAALISEWIGTVATNPPSWSVSVELANYLLFALVVSVLSRAGRWNLAVAAACMVTITFDPEWRLMRGIIEFVIGCCIFYCAHEFRIKGAPWVAGLFFVAPFLLPTFGFSIQYWHVAACFAALVFFMTSGSSRDPFTRLCGFKPLVFLGDISYSVYLLQWFIWIGWKHVLAKTSILAPHPYLMVMSAAASVIAASAISYQLLEKPARIWIRNRFQAGQAAPAILEPSGAGGR